jgi:hypothetical protein
MTLAAAVSLTVRRALKAASDKATSAEVMNPMTTKVAANTTARTAPTTTAEMVAAPPTNHAKPRNAERPGRQLLTFSRSIARLSFPRTRIAPKFVPAGLVVNLACVAKWVTGIKFSR